MFDLVPLYLLLLVLTGFSEAFSKKKNNLSGYVYKERIIWLIMAIICAVFAGLRIKFNDTSTYTESYVYLTKASLDFSDVKLTFADSPGFVITNQVLKYLGVSVNGFLLVYATVTYIIYLWFIRKNSTDFLVSVILFFCFVHTFPMAAIRQCIAIAFCLVAVDRAIKKRWFFFVFWVFVSMLFHAYSFFYLLVPLLMFVPWSDNRTFKWIAVFFVMGILLRPFLGTVIDMTDMLGSSYNTQEFMGAGVHPLRLMVAIVPLVLSYVIREDINNPANEVTKEEGLLMNLTFLNGELMFIALFGTSNFFVRFANYFYVFPCITLPRLFNLVKEDRRRQVKYIAIILYILFMWYDNTYSGFAKFDISFEQMPLSEFHFFD